MIETLHYGWSWQNWDESVYPGPTWNFWMKCCPRCWAGPLTDKADQIMELCINCKFAISEDRVVKGKNALSVVGWLSTSGHQTVINSRARRRL